MRRTCLLLVLIATVAIAAPVATGQTDPPVVVTVVCDPNGTATAHVNMDPYPRTLSQVSRWRLNINQPNQNSIAIATKNDPERPWPYTQDSYASTNGLLEIPPAEFTGQTGTFWYNVVYSCDGQTQLVLDPRMEIGRGGGN